MRDNELAALKAENAELRGRLDAVEAKLAPKPRPVALIDDGVKITHPEIYTCTMPDPTNCKNFTLSCSPNFHSLVPGR